LSHGGKWLKFDMLDYVIEFGEVTKELGLNRAVGNWSHLMAFVKGFSIN